MAGEESIDVEEELENLLIDIQPNLQDVIKRSFKNVAFKQCSEEEFPEPDLLEDVSYFAKNTQVNLSKLELVKPPSFHLQSLSLDLGTMQLKLRCSLGEVNVKGLYSAFNENLYNLIPVMSEGHVLVSLHGVCGAVEAGLAPLDDALAALNPSTHFTHDEVQVKLSWPSPQPGGGYEFTTAEQLAKHIDDLPLSAAVSGALHARLARRLRGHVARALRHAASLSQLLPRPSLVDAYSAKVLRLSAWGDRLVDELLLHVRRLLLQGRQERQPLPPLHAAFMYKTGGISHLGKLSASGGWLKDLATVHRARPVSVHRAPGRLTLRATLAFTDLQLGYDSYVAAAGGAGAGGAASGRLGAAFAAARVHLALTVGAGWEPYAQLDELAFCKLEAGEVHTPGLAQRALAARAAGWARAAARAAALAPLRRDLHRALALLPLHDLVAGS